MAFALKARRHRKYTLDDHPLVSCPTRWSLYWPLALCVDLSRETGYSNVLAMWGLSPMSELSNARPNRHSCRMQTWWRHTLRISTWRLFKLSYVLVILDFYLSWVEFALLVAKATVGDAKFTALLEEGCKKNEVSIFYFVWPTRLPLEN